MYRFCPTTKDYTSYIFWPQKSDTCDIELRNVSPLHCKLLPGDIIDTRGKIIESPYRSYSSIPGILVVDGKTYGRKQPTSSSTSHRSSMTKFDKSYYKCIPSDNSLPHVLVLYSPNTREKKIGGVQNTQYTKNDKKTFSKHKTNLYVLFKIDEWTDKHPICSLTNVLGPIDIANNYYEYLLYSNKLMSSITIFTKITQKRLREKIDTHIHDKKYSRDQNIPNLCNIHENGPLEDRTDQYIFTIDPSGTRDIDDAIGVSGYNAKDDTVTVSVYIANVTWWLDYLELWDSISEREATVYLPNKNIPMLPKILSENKISLFENELRPTCAMDILIRNNTVCSISFRSALIKVSKNYDYEDKYLLADENYREILKYTKVLNTNHYKYIDNIRDSHDVIAYFMLYMNHEAAKILSTYQVGIYRSVTMKNNTMPCDRDMMVPPDLKKFIQLWKYTSAEYTTYDKQRGHVHIGECGGITEYLQLTSPIRRKVDIINMSLLMIHTGLLVSSEPMKLINYAIENITKINTTMKAIKKVQNIAKIYDLCIRNVPSIPNDNKMESRDNVEGIIIDQTHTEEEAPGITTKIKHTIYIPSLELVTHMLLTNEHSKLLKLYGKYEFSIHLFTDEDSLHRRIRIYPRNIEQVDRENRSMRL